MPLASSSISRESPSQPGKDRCALPGSRCTGSPFRIASGTTARTPSTSAVRNRVSSPANCSRRLAASRIAVAKPSTPGVFRVPERTSRSWPPPCSTGMHSTPRPSSSAPVPYAPPSLCAVTVIASTPESAKDTGRMPAACTASVWNGMPCSCAIAASCSIGWMVPTSLFAHMMLTTATASGSSAIAAARVSGRTPPWPSTGSSTNSACSCSASQRAESSTAWCSTALISTLRRRGSAARRER